MDELAPPLDEVFEDNEAEEVLPEIEGNFDLPEEAVDWPEFDEPEPPGYSPPDLLPELPEADEDFSIHPNPGPEFPENPEGEPLPEGRPPDRKPQFPEGGSTGGPERGY